jgi:hypothetical protein
VRGFGADNYDRVTAKVQDWVASGEYQAECKYDGTLHQERWNLQELPTLKAGDAADLKSENH